MKNFINKFFFVISGALACFLGILALIGLVGGSTSVFAFCGIFAVLFLIPAISLRKKIKTDEPKKNEVPRPVPKTDINAPAYVRPAPQTRVVKPAPIMSDVERSLKGARYIEIKPTRAVLRGKGIENPITDYKNITKATPREKFSDFVAIDTETTGLKPGGNDIIEVAAVRFRDFDAAEVYHTYCSARKPIPAEASAVNGITDEMIAGKPKFTEIATQLNEFIGKSILVAHNAPFDVRFLHGGGLDLSHHNGKVYDTLKLAKAKVKDYDGQKPDSYKLEDLCDEFGIRADGYHSALTDAVCCGLLFIEILEKVYDSDTY